jgi:hypothetical protein
MPEAASLVRILRALKAWPERRRGRRRPPGAHASCRVARGSEPIACLRLRDVSETGAGLLVGEAVQPGELLLLTLSNALLPGEHGVLLRVSYCKPSAGAFAVGGAFCRPLGPSAWLLLTA